MRLSRRLGPDGVAADIDGFAGWLLDEHLIAVIPGSVFGETDHVRLSFAAASDQLEAAFERLSLALGVRQGTS